MIVIEDNLLEAPKERTNVVYIISRKDTGEVVYIGKTIRYKIRKAQHINPNTWLQKERSALYNAFRKYGPENFDFEIFSCYETEQAAYDMEIKLISIKKPRYNIANGGGTPTAPKEIRKEWLKGTCKAFRAVKAHNLKTRETKCFESLTEAAKYTGTTTGSIHRIITNKQNTHNGWIFSTEGEPDWETLSKKALITIDDRKKVKGTHVKTGESLFFDSLSDASRELQIPTTNISKVCRGQRQTAKNYRWEYVL